MIYGVGVIDFIPGKVNEGLERIEKSMSSASETGKLVGCWYTELGVLNRVLIIRSHASGDDLVAEQQALLTGADPYGVSELTHTIAIDAFATFPNVDFMPPGKVGPIFEVRTYRLKRSGLTSTFAAWGKVLDKRVKISPIVTVMYALTGVVPRFMHIWPFPSLNDRATVRAEAASQGVWPPPGGLPHIENMQSDIYMAAAFSPIK